MTANDNATAERPLTTLAAIVAELGHIVRVYLPDLKDILIGGPVGRVEKGRVIIRGRLAMAGINFQRCVPVADLGVAS